MLLCGGACLHVGRFRLMTRTDPFLPSPIKERVGRVFLDNGECVMGEHLLKDNKDIKDIKDINVETRRF